MPWILIFFLTPIAEMYLLIEVAGYIEVWPTIFLVMLTAVVGVAILRQQGIATLARGIAKMRSGQLPAQEMVEGLCLAVAGALLITPGFATDAIGFFLLTPVSRQWFAKALLARVQIRTPDDLFRASGGQSPGYSADLEPDARGSRPGATLEGEFRDREAHNNELRDNNDSVDHDTRSPDR